jgi:hypothetical protein
MFHQCYAPGSWLQQLIKVDEIEKKIPTEFFQAQMAKAKKSEIRQYIGTVVKSDNTLEQLIMFLLHLHQPYPDRQI